MSIKVAGEGMKEMAPDELYLNRATIDWLPDAGSRRPYRVLAVPPLLTLYSLANAIVKTFDFDFDYAFGFYDNLQHWTKSIECYNLFVHDGLGLEDWNSRCRSAKQTKVKHVFCELRDRFLFLFDYGNEWHFILRFEGIAPRERSKKYHLILKSFGNPPPQYAVVDDIIDDVIGNYALNNNEDDDIDNTDSA
jgi:hypothetical protein